MQNHTILSDQDVAQPDRSYELNPSDVAGILDAVDREDRDQLVAQMEPLHAADIADLLEQCGLICDDIVKVSQRNAREEKRHSTFAYYDAKRQKEQREKKLAIQS